MTEPDIRSLLTSRARAKVNARDNSLIGKRAAVEMGPAERQSADEPNAEAGGVPQPQLPDLSTLQAELESLPQVGKRLAVHLDQPVRAALLQLCDRHELTPEIFIEATLVLLQERPELGAIALEDARVRLAQRKRAGLLRRTIAMAQKYSR